jgi:hypothetical protein
MVKLDQAAKVIWNEVTMRPVTLGKKIDTSATRDFESVPNAVRFVMEKLSPSERATAMIQTDEAGLLTGEIEVLYSRLKQS